MALTKKQVLSDAGSLVVEITAELAAEGMTPEDNRAAMEDMYSIFATAAKIIEGMLDNYVQPTIH
jgi:hypothetical protein